MPRTKKMCGDDSSSEGDGIFDSINTGSKRAVKNIKALGDGLRVKMSKAQHRTLKRGGKITIKPEMLHEMGEFVPMAEALMKKAMIAMKKGKGIRISQSPTGIPSNSESLLGEAVPQPQLAGKGYRFGDFLNDIRPVTDFLRPLAEAGRDKGVEKIQGYGIDGGSFLAAGALPTAITGQNTGMIQQGSPYANPYSQSMRPFVPSHSQLSGTNKLSTHKSSRIYRK